jgi:hypothetical protein
LPAGAYVREHGRTAAVQPRERLAVGKRPCVQGFPEAHMNIGVRLGLAGVMIGAVAAMSGCLVSGNSHQTTSGAYVGPSTFNQVEVGTTTEEWVLATFGTPTSRTKLNDGSEILKWSYTQTKSGSGSVFLLYGGSNSTEKQGAAFVQLRDGVVTKAWRD